MFVPTRWLLELYPIDEILRPNLKIDRKSIRFEMAPHRIAGLRRSSVTAKGGASLFRGTFDPADCRAAVLRSLS
jgi:hypothetical protein